MKAIFKRHTISFKNAWAGLIWALNTQPNYKIHLTLSLLAIIGGVYCHLFYTEWLIVGFLITFGLVIETINTALEVTTDAIDVKEREDLKIAKDVSAAAMLIFAIGAFIIAIIIFGPKIETFF
jgi:diacylglycerol kinase